MRLHCFALYLISLMPLLLAAQEKPGSRDFKNESVPPKGIYRFPAFTEGTVVMRNSIIISQQFNYNISLNEMHFISEKGDTLSLADPAGINFISLNGSRFYYDKGYLQTIDTAAGMTLAFRQILVVQHRRESAYGTKEAHEGLRSYHFYIGNGQVYQTGEDEKVIIAARESYFFGDAYGHFSKADKAFILQYFRKQETAVKTFIQNKHTNFNKLEDLKQLMKFCREL